MAGKQKQAAEALSTIEGAKKQAAIRAVEEHFDPASHKIVGIGSGTTIIYVVEAIKERGGSEHIRFVPTGFQSRQAIVKAGLTPMPFDSLAEGQLLDVCFDGADEVDDELNCIKGGGACLFQEKLVATKSKKFVCVADYRKLQPRLLTNWPSIPVEIAPIAMTSVLHALKRLGSIDPIVREGHIAKAGPLKTDQDFFIIDAPFKPLLTEADVAAGKQGNGKDGIWEVSALAHRIKLIQGVLDVGLFEGANGFEVAARGEHAGGQKPVAAYFGMENGEVLKRTAKSSKLGDKPAPPQ
ncbi:ribose 5-phosphate isomerase A [Xylona heveae TC161]|uniref:Ribose-5-phosphate isomerase n=1 Tax=Xylona heveae (strain CBS 132557 / TC161) TaxID=1328760 RepID=A0A164ZNI1_XYLHT|nr:ribose 5-phosphate isomerase A [Xylona heveae TC161]KZF19310.1 ribose 5-phosphate isomerase A [Xylona heveae TC161]